MPPTWTTDVRRAAGRFYELRNAAGVSCYARDATLDDRRRWDLPYVQAMLARMEAIVLVVASAHPLDLRWTDHRRLAAVGWAVRAGVSLDKARRIVDRLARDGGR